MLTTANLQQCVARIFSSVIVFTVGFELARWYFETTATTIALSVQWRWVAESKSIALMRVFPKATVSPPSLA